MFELSYQIEFTPCEKQKYQVSFVTKNKKILFHLHTTISPTVSNLKAHTVHD